MQRDLALVAVELAVGAERGALAGRREARVQLHLDPTGLRAFVRGEGERVAERRVDGATCGEPDGEPRAGRERRELCAARSLCSRGRRPASTAEGVTRPFRRQTRGPRSGLPCSATEARVCGKAEWQHAREMDAPVELESGLTVDRGLEVAMARRVDLGRVVADDAEEAARRRRSGPGVPNTSTPPGRVTRRSSDRAASSSRRCSITLTQTSASKAPSSNGKLEQRGIVQLDVDPEPLGHRGDAGEPGVDVDAHQLRRPARELGQADPRAVPDVERARRTGRRRAGSARPEGARGRAMRVSGR